MKNSNKLLPEWRDTNIHPTDNFYTYANGNWLATHPIPEDYPMWGAFTEIQDANDHTLHGLLTNERPNATHSEQIARNYFASGMNTALIESDGLTPLNHYISLINAANDTRSVTIAIAALQSIGVSVPFSLDVSPDFDDASVNLLYVSQAGLGLPERSYYIRKDDQAVQLQTAYKSHIAQQLVNTGFVTAQDASSVAKTVYDLEYAIAEVSLPAEELRNVELTLNKMAFNKFAEKSRYIDISLLWSELGIPAQTISINNIAFFKHLSNLFDSAPPETIKQYLLWHLVRNYASVLPSKIESAAFDFYGTLLSGQATQKPRWKRVLQHATNDIGEAVAQIFVQATFSEQSKQRCEEMVKNLLAAMQSSIRNLEWMSEPTKKAALHKLSKFNYKIGYPSIWRNYDSLRIDATSSLATNKILATQFEVNYQLAKVGQLADTTEWSMPAHVVNAYYHPLLNEIVFPAGILQPPMFFADADDATMYGSIGAVIGHEITHGFDDQGSKFDEHGKLHNWWNEKDRNEFEIRAKKLVEQYSKYTVFGKNNVNGKLTLGENIADLGGLTIAYEALRLSKNTQPLTAQESKQFFLAYATIWRMNYKPEIAELLLTIDTHSPAEYRANGPLSNFEPFFVAYNVDETSPMRRKPQDIVKIW